MTAHKHAELMKQYAEDAAETDKPWERWEMHNGVRWYDLSKNPLWRSDHEYRRKPRTININGREVPEPYRGEMENGRRYFIPTMGGGQPSAIPTRWAGDSIDNLCLQRGLVHLTTEAAEAHARALLSFTDGGA